MSTEQTQVQEPPKTPPQEVLQLIEALQDLNQYKSSVMSGTYPGGHVTPIAKLINFLTESYKQVYAKYMAHPFVVEELARQQKAAEEAAKERVEKQAQKTPN